MAQADSRTIYVFCDTCRRNVQIDIPPGKDAKRTGGLLSVVSIHGSPAHAVVAYVDSMFRVRGLEYPETVTVENVAASLSDKTLERLASETGLSLTSILKLLNERQKDAIRALALILTQAMTGMQVICVHSDPDVAAKFVDMVGRLFSGQSVKISSAGHSNMKKRPLKDMCVYDMVEKRFITEGPKSDPTYLERVIGELTTQENAYAQLKIEVSKIFFAYERAKSILSSAVSPILDTWLATEISIDLALIPVLLDMAESQGLRLRDKVLKNGLGHVIRSI